MMTALSRSALYEAMARGDFPRPIRIGPRGVRWIAAEIQDWNRAPPAGRIRPAGLRWTRRRLSGRSAVE